MAKIYLVVITDYEYYRGSICFTKKEDAEDFIKSKGLGLWKLEGREKMHLEEKEVCESSGTFNWNK